MKSRSGIYLLVAFIEGASVMAVELLGARMIAPWFGASLYVWASVLGVTMTGLAGGYFLGGRISAGMKSNNALFVLLALASFFTAIMPYSSGWIMQLTLHWDVRWGSLFSSLVFLFPPMLLMGMISPVIVRLCASSPEQSGKVAGTVYAVSTIGGIICTFITGFVIIPHWGLKMPALVFAGLLALPAIAGLAFRKAWPGTMLVCVMISLGMAAGNFLNAEPAIPEGVTLLHRSDGIMGRVTVTEEKTNRGVVTNLYINGLLQSSRQWVSQCSDHPYVYSMATLASFMPAGSRSLLLGTGAGSLLTELVGIGHEVDAVEIDERLLQLGEKYFDTPVQKATIITDDARHYLNTMQGMRS
jgi:predicted membrane-bound spermidine synthase